MSDAPVVLFVDDNDAVRLVLAHVLERGGYEVLQAASAEEAYATLRAGHRPELIITDVVMAGDGIVGLRDRLQASGHSVPFLVISGYPLAHIARDMGVPGTVFMQKPFSPQALLSEVNRMLASR